MSGENRPVHVPLIMHVPRVVAERGDTADYVLTAVDANPRYTRFLDDWIRSWLVFSSTLGFDVLPIVVLTDGDPSRVEIEHRDHVSRVEVPDGVHSALAAQVVRLLAPGRLGLDSSVIMTSDIDMFPVGAAYFDLIYQRARTGFVVGRDVLSDIEEYPMCYLAGRSSAWRELFSVSPSLTEDLAALVGLDYSGVHGGTGWNIDQRLAFDRISGIPDVVRLQDPETGHRRLDRSRGFMALVETWSRRRMAGFADYHAHDPGLVGGMIASTIIRRLRSFHSERSSVGSR